MILSALVSATQENYDGTSLAAEIDSVARTDMNAKLVDSVPN